MSRATRLSVADVVAENLHHHVAARADDHFLHAHVDRLRERVGDARNVVEHLAHLARSASGVPLPRHSFFGASVMNMSVSFRPAGSMPSSSAPARAMMRRISGIGVISSRWMRRSVCAASSTETVGILADRHDRRAFVHHRHEGLADVQVGDDRRHERRPSTMTGNDRSAAPSRARAAGS